VQKLPKVFQQLQSLLSSNSWLGHYLCYQEVIQMVPLKMPGQPQYERTNERSLFANEQNKGRLPERLKSIKAGHQKIHTSKPTDKSRKKTKQKIN